MEERLAQAGIQVNGTFDVRCFFETLALILSKKENMSITVTVHHKEGEQQSENKNARKIEKIRILRRKEYE